MIKVYKVLTAVSILAILSFSAFADDAAMLTVRNQLWEEGVTTVKEANSEVDVNQIIANLQVQEEERVIPEELQVVMDRYFLN